MVIDVCCPGCGTNYPANEQLAGRTLPCPRCREPIAVPGHSLRSLAKIPVDATEQSVRAGRSEAVTIDGPVLGCSLTGLRRLYRILMVLVVAGFFLPAVAIYFKTQHDRSLMQWRAYSEKELAHIKALEGQIRQEGDKLGSGSRAQINEARQRLQGLLTEYKRRGEAYLRDAQVARQATLTYHERLGQVAFAWLALVFVQFLVFCFLLYRQWGGVQGDGVRTTPGLAAVLLLVPVFNVFWVFRAVCGLARHLSRSSARLGGRARPGTVALAVVFCVAHALAVSLTLPGLFLSLPALGVLEDVQLEVAGRPVELVGNPVLGGILIAAGVVCITTAQIILLPALNSLVRLTGTVVCLKNGLDPERLGYA